MLLPASAVFSMLLLPTKAVPLPLLTCTALPLPLQSTYAIYPLLLAAATPYIAPPVRGDVSNRHPCESKAAAVF